jgi:UDP-N-acetylglucosamine acyltransferase
MIHPTAVIDPQAQLGQNVEVAPYAVIGANVVLGDGCKIGPHVHLSGHTEIGCNTEIHAGANIGDKPQDYHYSEAETTYTRIGSDCIIREYVTIHRGTTPGSATIIGNHVMLMAFVHIGHNCQLADDVIIANNSILGGYVEVGFKAFISSTVLIHQFVHVGSLAMLSGLDRITQDVPPYCVLALGGVHGPNVVGLKRAGFDLDARKGIRTAIKQLYFAGLNHQQAIDSINAEFGEIPEVMALVDFVRSSKRGIMPGRATTA